MITQQKIIDSGRIHLNPQTFTVLSFLFDAGKKGVSPSEARIVHQVESLSSQISRIKRWLRFGFVNCPFKISAIWKIDQTGKRYRRYFLQKIH